MNEQLAVNYCAGCARYGVVLAATGVPLQQADYADIGLVDRNTFHHVFSGLEGDQRSELEQWVEAVGAPLGKNEAPTAIAKVWKDMRAAISKEEAELTKKVEAIKDSTERTEARSKTDGQVAGVASSWLGDLTKSVKTYGDSVHAEKGVRLAYINQLKTALKDLKAKHGNITQGKFKTAEENLDATIKSDYSGVTAATGIKTDAFPTEAITTSAPKPAGSSKSKSGAPRRKKK